MIDCDYSTELGCKVGTIVWEVMWVVFGVGLIIGFVLLMGCGCTLLVKEIQKELDGYKLIRRDEDDLTSPNTKE